jgi:hypothetical protein
MLAWREECALRVAKRLRATRNMMPRMTRRLRAYCVVRNLL